MIKTIPHDSAVFRLKNLLLNHGDKTLIEHFESQDEHLKRHQIRVACMASRIAAEAGLTDEQEESIFMAACLHDIGMQEFKLANATNEHDWLIMMERFRMHPETGAKLVSAISCDIPIDSIIMQHHERLDGSGFPNMIKEIMIEAQIVATADIIDGVYALHAGKHEEGLVYACNEINNMRSRLLDENLVDVSITLAENDCLIQSGTY